ncbi:MAG: phage morphogenesis protein [Leptospira sp.]|nr:phage morphogenesis protein [Leptospira sp.]
MSGLQITDGIGPMLAKAGKQMGASMDRATGKNALLVQRNVEVGIRRQKYKADWKALKEATIKEKKRKNQSNLTLVAEGDLSSSFEVLKRSFGIYETGTMSKYARAQAFGFEARGIPARDYWTPAIEESFPQMKVNWTEGLRDIFK